MVFIVLPTYNEAENLPILISKIINLPFHSHILIVDDNSPDGTGALADQIANQQNGRVSVLHRQKKQGLGPAYIEGLQSAIDSGAELIVQMDADLSHDPRYLVDMLRMIEGSDLVLGSRYIPGGSVAHSWPAYRKMLSRFGNFYTRAILGIPVHDFTTGFRLWRAEALARLPLDQIKSDGYAFLIELLYLAYLYGLRISESPIHFPDRRNGDSKMSINIQIEAAYRVLWIRQNFPRPQESIPHQAEELT